jgi:hypothetical protein
VCLWWCGREREGREDKVAEAWFCVREREKMRKENIIKID